MRLVARLPSLTSLLPAVLAAALLVVSSAPAAHAKISRVFIVPLSHLDIGFTATPREVSEHFQKDVDLALRVVSNRADAYWNIETFWQLEQWLKAQTDTTYPLLDRAWATGRLGIGAAYASMHSGLLTGEELIRMLYPAQELAGKLGISLTTAVMNDVPGFAWYVPQALNASGIRRLILGINLQFDGGAQITARNVPFYWEGPDGSKVLTWVSREGYLEGAFHWELHNADRFKTRLQELERAGYPYDAVLVIDGYGDNAGIDKIISRLDALRRLRFSLNEIGVEVEYSTIDAFFDYMEEKYGDQFPTLRGDWGRSWEVGRVSGPWQMARYRELQRLVPAAESLATIAWATAGLPYPEEKLASAWGYLALLGEHTGGVGTGWPDLVTAQQVDESNRTVLSYVTEARALVDETIETAFGTIVGVGDHPDLTETQSVADVWVYNPLSWSRAAVVTLPLDELPLAPASRYRVFDPETGHDLPSAVVDDHLVFRTGALPSVGVVRYRVDVDHNTAGAQLAAGEVLEKDKALEGGEALTADVTAGDVTEDTLVLENERHRIVIDPQAGWIVEWHDKQSGRQVVNRVSPYRFNQLLTATQHVDFIGGTPTPIRPDVAAVEAIDNALYAGVRIVYADGTPWHATEILLPKADDRVEIHNVLDRGRMRHVPYAQHSDHYYFAFPLSISTRQLDVRYLGATRFQSLAHDTMRGGNANGIISLGAVDLRDGEWGATVAHREAFAFSVGGIGHSSAIFLPREATLIAHVVQKADEGQTKDKGVTTFDIEPGAPDLLRFSFAFALSEGEFDPVAATRQALEWVTPSVTWATSAGTVVQPASTHAAGPGSGQSMIAVDQPNVIVTALKQAARNRDAEEDARDIVVRLQEIAGMASVVRLETPLPVLSATRVNAVEYELEGGHNEVHLDRLELKPYETLTLKLRLRD